MRYAFVVSLSRPSLPTYANLKDANFVELVTDKEYVTNDPDLVERIKRLECGGISKEYTRSLGHSGAGQITLYFKAADQPKKKVGRIFYFEHDMLDEQHFHKEFVQLISEIKAKKDNWYTFYMRRAGISESDIEKAKK